MPYCSYCKTQHNYGTGRFRSCPNCLEEKLTKTAKKLRQELKGIENRLESVRNDIRKRKKNCE